MNTMQTETSISPRELQRRLAAGQSARLLDVRTPGEFAAGHGLTWWTPFYMNGSSYGLNHSQGFYLLPGLLLAKFVSLPVAIKLTSLLAIFAGGLAMYGCARYFIGGRGSVRADSERLAGPSPCRSGSGHAGGLHSLITWPPERKSEQSFAGWETGPASIGF